MHDLSVIRYLNETAAKRKRNLGPSEADKAALNEIAKRHKAEKPKRIMVGALGITII